MKKRLRFITIAFSVSFLIMAGLSLYSLNRFTVLTTYSYWVDHTNKVIKQLYQLETIVKDIDRYERGYMLTKDTAYQNALSRVIRKLNPAIDSVQQLTKDNETEQKNIILIKSALALRVGYLRQNLNFIDTNRSDIISSYYYEGRSMMQDCMKRLNEMHSIENGLMIERTNNKRFYQNITSTTLKYILIAFCVITILSFVLMIRELKKRISYQDELQNKILDLQRSHAELEQIAYAASHDLQEPLRKIQVFTNRFFWLKKDGLDDESKDTIERVSSAASRMQELIEDLVNLTSLTRQDNIKERVDLNKTIAGAMAELNDKIREKDILINVEVMPEVIGYTEQLQALFKALLDNSIKFTRHGVQPTISIRHDVVGGEELANTNKGSYKKYYRITISDNGIGFDNKFTDKMFQIFQRLHAQQSEYRGKGIGLAISQRIMANHQGYILAFGHPDIGATFKLFFPLEG